MRWLRIRDSSTDINGSNHGQVITGDGNTVTFVKNDHIVLEDYDMSKSIKSRR